MSFLQCFTQKTAFWLITGNQEFYRLLKRLWAWSLFVFPSLDLSIRIGYLYNGLQNLTSIAIIPSVFQREPFRWIMICQSTVGKACIDAGNDTCNRRLIWSIENWVMQTYRLSMIYAVLSRSHLGEANQPTKIFFKQFMQFSNWKSQLLLHSLFRVSSLLEQSGR